MEANSARGDANPFLQHQSDQQGYSAQNARVSAPAPVPPIRVQSDFSFPTNPSGHFAQAMSAIACNAEAGAKGVFNLVSGGDDTFKEQVTQALAIKLNLKTNQQANERALRNLLQSKGRNISLKQALQARAAVYGHALDTAWFCKNFDLCSRTQNIHRRRLARSMLAGAPLFMAQTGAQEIRMQLSRGDDEVFTGGNLATRGTAGQFIKMLSKMSILGILKLINKPRFDEVTELLLQHADDLDYIQSLLNLLGEKPELNPPMNAVSDAFNRRRFTGGFKQENQSVVLDTLLNANTKTPKDDDSLAIKDESSTKRSTRSPGESPGNYCFHFQNNRCTFRNCKFRHICMRCQASGHGSSTCSAVLPISRNLTGNTATVPATAQARGPPHPRFRRDRAFAARQ